MDFILCPLSHNANYVYHTARLQILHVQPWKTNNSATVTYSDTAMAKHKRLQYSLRHSGQSGGKFVNFEPPYLPSVCHSGDSVSSVEQQYSQRNIHNKLRSGKKYLLKLRAEYNIGRSTLQRESEEFAFSTLPSTGTYDCVGVWVYIILCNPTYIHAHCNTTMCVLFNSRSAYQRVGRLSM